MSDELTSEERAKLASARLRQDREDFHNELSGNETGRRSRFLGGRLTQAEQIEKTRKDRRFRDMLDLLLQDPEYRALYEELGNKLARAETHADTVIANLEAMLRDLDAEISEMEARAAKGPDGQPVFKTADGRVVDASGRALPPEIAAGIIWPPGAPSAEEYFGAKERRAETETLLDDWRDYRTDTLGSLRDRHTDRDAPMTKDELRKALDQIQANAPATAKTVIQEPDSAATQSAKLDAGAVPTALR